MSSANFEVNGAIEAPEISLPRIFIQAQETVSLHLADVNAVLQVAFVRVTHVYEW